ncbi:MAG: metal-dependent transcriptional regulator [Acetivibrio sp.]
MKRQESKEDYLETILILKNRISMVRSIDIVNEMNFTKPSVSIGMKNLREGGFITMDTNGYITLTEQGEKIASCVYERHLVLTEALVAIGVSKETAKADACRVEHDISTETFDKIKEHLKKHAGNSLN